MPSLKGKRSSSRRKKGGSCGCSASSASASNSGLPFAAAMNGGSGMGYNSGLSAIPAGSTIPLNSLIGSSSDPFSNLSTNFTNTRLLGSAYSGGNKKKQGKRMRQKGGHENMQIMSDREGYVFETAKFQNTVNGGKSSRRNGGKNRKGKTRKTLKGKTRKNNSRKQRGGNGTSIENQNSNAITGMASSSGVYNSAALLTGRASLGDNAPYNQPIANSQHNQYYV